MKIKKANGTLNVMRTLLSMFLLTFGLVAIADELSHSGSNVHRLLLDKLEADRRPFSKYKILFEETSMVYELPDRRALLDSIKTGRDIPSPKRAPGQGAATHTNIIRSEFICWPVGGQLLRKVYDVSGAPKYNSGAFFGEGFLCNYNQKVFNEEHDTLRSGWGEVNTRQRTEYSGAPIFASKGTLLDFILDAAHITSGEEVLTNGRTCYVLMIKKVSSAPTKSYRLFFETDNLEPVALYSYLDDGTLFSTTDLNFSTDPSSTQAVTFVCKEARSSVYDSGNMRSKSIWVLKAFDADISVNEMAAESFFPERTRVVDNRHSKPLSYHMGKRMPTATELALMLTTTNGVALYEAATSRLLPGDTLGSIATINKARRPIVWGILAFLVLVPLCLWIMKAFCKHSYRP